MNKTFFFTGNPQITDTNINICYILNAMYQLILVILNSKIISKFILFRDKKFCKIFSFQDNKTLYNLQCKILL